VPLLGIGYDKSWRRRIENNFESVTTRTKNETGNWQADIMFYSLLSDIVQFTHNIFSSRIDRDYKKVQDLLVQLRQKTAKIIGIRKALCQTSTDTSTTSTAESIDYYERLEDVSYRELQVSENVLSEMYCLKEILAALKSVDLFAEDRLLRRQIDLLCEQYSDLSKRISKEFSSKLNMLRLLTTSRDEQRLGSWSENIELQLKVNRSAVWCTMFDSIENIRNDAQAFYSVSHHKNDKATQQLNNLKEARDQLRKQHQNYLDLLQRWCNRAAIAKVDGKSEQAEQAEMRSCNYRDLASNVERLLKLFDELTSAMS
jgi:hypothetical protein